MPAPTFVGAGPAAYDLVDAWPASLPISASTPAGVADGDRVICVVTTFATEFLTVTMPTPIGWTLVDSGAVNVASGPQHLGTWIFTARWGADVKDQLVQPTSNAAASRSWRLQCMAWRPSKPIARSVKAGDIGNFYISTPGTSNVYGPNDGSTAVLVQVTRNGGFTGTLGGFYALVPYSVRVDQAAILNRGGALRMADGSTTQNFTSTFGSWSRSYTGSTYSLVFGLIIEAPVFDAVGGWAVGRIAY